MILQSELRERLEHVFDQYEAHHDPAGATR
jgi:hypothetical protein